MVLICIIFKNQQKNLNIYTFTGDFHHLSIQGFLESFSFQLHVVPESISKSMQNRSRHFEIYFSTEMILISWNYHTWRSGSLYFHVNWSSSTLQSTFDTESTLGLMLTCPKASPRIAFLRLERGSIRKCIHTIPATFKSDPELEIEPQVAE